jgi:hypothetical protein
VGAIVATVVDEVVDEVDVVRMEIQETEPVAVVVYPDGHAVCDVAPLVSTKNPSPAVRQGT